MKSIHFFISFILFIPGMLFGNGSSAGGQLPVPPVLEGKELKLDIRQGELELPFGTSKTLGFNGSYLGPTIRLSSGDLADISITNSISENTTVHWHGLHVPAES